MRLFELTSSPIVRMLMELDPNNPIDRELERTAQNAGKAGSLDPNDIADQGGDLLDDPMMAPPPTEPGMEPDPNQPDPGMGDMAEPEAVDTSKPVNTTILGAVQGHAYIKNYDHSDQNSRSHPIAITQMGIDELSDVRNQLQHMVTSASMANRIGSFDDPQVRAATDMLSFVDRVMSIKKQEARDEKAKKTGQPKVKSGPSPKTQAGKQIKPKK